MKVIHQITCRLEVLDEKLDKLKLKEENLTSVIKSILTEEVCSIKCLEHLIEMQTKVQQKMKVVKLEKQQHEQLVHAILTQSHDHFKARSIVFSVDMHSDKQVIDKKKLKQLAKQERIAKILPVYKG